MIKYSTQTGLFSILWVTKTIDKGEPMYSVLDKDTIKTEILPYLSQAKRGYATRSCMIEIVNTIFYELRRDASGSIFYENDCDAKK